VLVGKRSIRVTDVFFGSVRPPSACLRRLSHRRLDMLIEAEEVGRIILILQRYQPHILCRPIGGLHPLGTFIRLLPQIVDVHPTGREVYALGAVLMKSR